MSDVVHPSTGGVEFLPVPADAPVPDGHYLHTQGGLSYHLPSDKAYYTHWSGMALPLEPPEQWRHVDTDSIKLPILTDYIYTANLLPHLEVRADWLTYFKVEPGAVIPPPPKFPGRDTKGRFLQKSVV